MNPELAERILHAADVIRESIEDGVHPGAAERAVRCVNDTIRLRCHEEHLREDADGALGACEQATRTFPWNAEYAAEVHLRAAQDRLRRLVAIAEASVCAECCA